MHLSMKTLHGVGWRSIVQSGVERSGAEERVVLMIERRLQGKSASNRVVLLSISHYYVQRVSAHSIFANCGAFG